MTETLEFTPEETPLRSTKPRIKKAQFGDGYAQRAPDGINHQLSTWKLSHNTRKAAEIDYLTDFIDRHGGSKVFLWTPPGYVAPLRFICEDGYEETFEYSTLVKSLSFTLRQEP